MTLAELSKPIDAAPDIAKTVTEMEAAIPDRDRLAAILANYRRALASSGRADEPTVAVEERLEALEKVQGVDQQHTAAELRVVRLQTRLRVLRDAERVKRAALFQQERKKAVEALAKAFL